MAAGPLVVGLGGQALSNNVYVLMLSLGMLVPFRPPVLPGVAVLVVALVGLNNSLVFVRRALRLRQARLTIRHLAVRVVVPVACFVVVVVSAALVIVRWEAGLYLLAAGSAGLVASGTRLAWRVLLFGARRAAGALQGLLAVAMLAGAVRLACHGPIGPSAPMPCLCSPPWLSTLATHHRPSGPGQLQPGRAPVGALAAQPAGGRAIGCAGLRGADLRRARTSHYRRQAAWAHEDHELWLGRNTRRPNTERSPRADGLRFDQQSRLAVSTARSQRSYWAGARPASICAVYSSGAVSASSVTAVSAAPNRARPPARATSLDAVRRDRATRWSAMRLQISSISGSSAAAARMTSKTCPARS